MAKLRPGEKKTLVGVMPQSPEQRGCRHPESRPCTVSASPRVTEATLEWAGRAEREGRGQSTPNPGPAKATVLGKWAAVRPRGAGWLIAGARPLPWTVTQAPDRRDL